jgi:CheY-like chemotaxis protein
MSCNVLIVDDSPILRKAITKVVKLAGIDEDHIHEAGNGQEALEIIETVWIDLVLLDLNMPVMDGEEFAKIISEKDDMDRVQIVIVSTESNQDRLDQMKQYGVTESLRKPFEPEDLCKLIARTLGVKT